MVPNLLIKEVISKLAVICSSTLANKRLRQESGVEIVENRGATFGEQEYCTWSGTMGEAEDHYENNCGFKIIECPNNGCKTNYRRQLDNDHQKQCPFRVVNCTHCLKEQPFYESEDHERHCEFQILLCPNKCRDDSGNVRSFCLKDILTHREVCNLEVLKCPFAETGCNIQLPRYQMELHSSDFSIHSRGLLNTISRLINNEDALRQEVTMLREKLVEIEERDPLKAAVGVIPLLVSLQDLKRINYVFESRITKIGGIDFQLEIKHCTYEDSSAACLSLRLVEELTLFAASTVVEVELSSIVLDNDGNMDFVIVNFCQHCFCPTQPIFNSIIKLQYLEQPRYLLDGKITMKTTVRLLGVATQL